MPLPKLLRKTLSLLLAATAAAIVIVLVAIITFITLNPPTQLLLQPIPPSAQNPPQAAGLPHYTRPEVDTFYTYPEWYIVWSYQAKADHQSTHLPSTYPFFADIHQYWQSYGAIFAVTRSTYPTPIGDHVMLTVIGTSFSAEYALKGLYEKTIGALSERTSHHQLVEEDHYAAAVAQDYATFVHIRPFYEYSFAHALGGLWTKTPFRTTHLARTLERRAWLSLDYGIEAIYCSLIELATHATYGYEDSTTEAWTNLTPAANALIATPTSHIKILRPIDSPQANTPAIPQQAIIEIPRYQEFTPRAQQLIATGAIFHQIAGNNLILISVISPGLQPTTPSNTQQLLIQPLPATPGKSRVALLCRVSELAVTLQQLAATGQQLEHIYDY